MSQKKPVKKIRHHTIPKFYLKNFINEKETIWVYGKNRDFTPFEDIPDNIAVEKNYNTYHSSDGIKDSNTIEDWLNKSYEQDASSVIKKICANPQHNLSTEEKENFYKFIASMMVRSRNSRENIKFILVKTVEETLKKIAHSKSWFDRVFKDEEFEEFRQLILEGKIQCEENEYTDEYALSFQYNHIEKFADIFSKMHWQFYASTENFKFITSDNPLSIIDTGRQKGFYSSGLLSENIEISLPLSKNLVAIGAWQEKKIKRCNELVKVINRRTVYSAYKFIYASFKSEQLNKLVEKFIGKFPSVGVNNHIRKS